MLSKILRLLNYYDLKIAYLVLAHNNYEHLKRLVSALNEGESKFYIHIYKKSTLPDLNGYNIIFLHDRIDVHWSGFSIVKATLKLLQRAIQLINFTEKKELLC